MGSLSSFGRCTFNLKRIAICNFLKSFKIKVFYYKNHEYLLFKFKLGPVKSSSLTLQFFQIFWGEKIAFFKNPL